MNLRPAIFLDRDGVINQAVIRGGKPYPPASAAELVVPPDVPEALATLHADGFLLIVVTNQPDVARGTTALETVETIHDMLRSRLPIDDIYACCHDDDDGCECRKPLPGMLIAAADRWSVDLTRSYMVGDRWKDIEAGRRAGCITVLIVNPYSDLTRCRPDVCVTSLHEAAQFILDHRNRQS